MIQKKKAIILKIENNIEKNKNDKKLSIDFYETTTQSNSSTYEHEEEKIINNTKNKDKNKSNNYNDIIINEKNEINEIFKYGTNKDIFNNCFGNINNTYNNFQNLNLNSNVKISFNDVIFINLDKNKNNKNQKKKKIFDKEKKNNSINKIEPYNKFNYINKDFINPVIENTEILYINVKLSKNKYKIFKLRRFDDLFLTVKIFCEINSIEEKLMKPIIITVLCSLNTIYQVYNIKLSENIIKILKKVKDINNEN